jgi:hypothetical protein
MKHLGNFQFLGVPEAAENRLTDIRKSFRNVKAATALAGIYVILIAYFENEIGWCMRLFSTSRRMGTSCEKFIKGKEKILNFFKDSDIPELVKEVENFFATN